MRPPSSAGDYESPYTSVLIVDGAYYLIVDRRLDGFSARRLSAYEVRVARRTLDEAHADLEARLGGRRAQR